ncbi:MAG: putative bifunctional diguanylate cyclase/phosphodiesterase, partial [Candidatus Latescibacterota bacterium]
YDCVSRDVDEIADGKVARFAGDEFLILLENIGDYYDAAKVAKRLTETIAEPYMLRNREVSITSSIGISMYPSDGESIEEVIKNSDIAMYHAKSMGKNGFQFYSKSMNASAMTHLIMENELRKAMSREELSVYYQPMIDLSKGEIFSVEALARWHNAKLGCIEPVQFIPLAEEMGLIEEIDSWVLQTACSQILSWQECNLPELRVSVNISGNHFKKKNVLDMIDQVISTTRINPHYLDLEVTESILIEKDPGTLSILHALRNRGIKLSLDDFGMGFSSLNYLKSFPLDVLKIDQSFVRDMIQDPDSGPIVSAIIAMARILKLETVAEGVETKQQMEVLLEKDCYKMQGFWFSNPLAATEFEKFAQNFRTSRTTLK